MASTECEHVTRVWGRW